MASEYGESGSDVAVAVVVADSGLSTPGATVKGGEIHCVIVGGAFPRGVEVAIVDC